VSGLLLALVLGPASAAEAVGTYALDADDGGFTAANGFQWEWGAPAGQGPGGAFLGDGAWATKLETLYSNEIPDALRFPELDLTGIDRPMVSWWQWVEVDDGDEARLERWDPDAAEWAVGAAVYGDAAPFESAPEWREVFVDLAGAADLSDLRLTFAPNNSIQAPGWYVDEFTVWDGDAAPPGLSDLTLLDDTQDIAGPYAVSVTAVDDAALSEVLLSYQIDGGEVVSLVMTDGGGGRYEAMIPGQPPDTRISYSVFASDGENTASAPRLSLHTFRVYLPAPEGLSGPDGRVLGQTAALSWTAPEADHPVDSYQVWRGDALVADVADVTAEIPTSSGDNTYTVLAVYDVDGALWEGDVSEPLTLDVAYSEITGVSPASAYQGDSARVVITGQNLLLVDGEVGLDFGAGVTPAEVAVADVDTAVVTVDVAVDAEVGARDIVLSSGDVDLTVSGGFTVLDGADRPRLVSVQPDSIRQGEEVELLITTAGAIGDTLTLSAGAGIVVESVERSSDTTLTARVVVDPSAGLGDRDLIADDGLRLLTGASVAVETRIITVDKGCGAPLTASWLWLLSLGALVRRRR